MGQILAHISNTCRLAWHAASPKQSAPCAHIAETHAICRAKCFLTSWFLLSRHSLRLSHRFVLEPTQTSNVQQSAVVLQPYWSVCVSISLHRGHQRESSKSLLGTNISLHYSTKRQLLLEHACCRAVLQAVHVKNDALNKLQLYADHAAVMVKVASMHHALPGHAMAAARTRMPNQRSAGQPAGYSSASMHNQQVAHMAAAAGSQCRSRKQPAISGPHAAVSTPSAAYCSRNQRLDTPPNCIAPRPKVSCSSQRGTCFCGRVPCHPGNNMRVTCRCNSTMRFTTVKPSPRQPPAETATQQSGIHSAPPSRMHSKPRRSSRPQASQPPCHRRSRGVSSSRVSSSSMRGQAVQRLTVPASSRR